MYLEKTAELRFIQKSELPGEQWRYKSEYDVVYKKLRCRSNNAGSGRILEELEENLAATVGFPAVPVCQEVVTEPRRLQADLEVALRKMNIT
jgi:hypothetical protein